MKNRKIMLLLCGVLAAAMLTACGGKDTEDKTNPNKDAANAQDKDSEAQGLDEAGLGKGGEYKQYDETAFMLNGKEIKLPYYGAENLCEETGLFAKYGVGSEELGVDSMDSSAEVKLSATEDDSEEWSFSSATIFVDNIGREKPILTKDGYVTGFRIGEEVEGVEFSVRGIQIGSTEEELKAAFSEFTPDGEKCMEAETEDDGTIRYTFTMTVPDTYHEVEWYFEVQNGKVCTMFLGSGSVSWYYGIDE